MQRHPGRLRQSEGFRAMSSETTLIIPIEGQAREFDCKLLLGCAGAEAGCSAILGSQIPVHLQIACFPRGINFSCVNAFAASNGPMRPAAGPGNEPTPSNDARDTASDFARGLGPHKFALVDHFKELVPAIATALPGHSNIARPHPSENHGA
jgi:hypothetical protein